MFTYKYFAQKKSDAPFFSSIQQCKDENAESHPASTEQNSNEVDDTQQNTEINSSSQINDDEEDEANSNETKPDPYSFSEDDNNSSDEELENANNSTLDGEESIKASASEEDPAGVR